MDWFLERLQTSVTDPFQYYATDWLAVICTGVYLWLVGNKRRDAFLWGAAGNVFFVVLNLMIESVPGMVFNIIFLALNARAFVRWGGGGDEGAGDDGVGRV